MPSPRSAKLGRWLLACIVAAIAVLVALATPPWQVQDMGAYRGAADRLVAGQSLYPAPGPVLDTSDVYRYAPWFAVLWIPLRWVPDGAMAVAWSLVLLGASGAAVYPLLRRAEPLSAAVAALGFVLCLRAAAIGNVEPLVTAMLVHGVERRSGPLWIALAASLKAAPMLFVLVYLGRGEWRRAASAVLLAVILVAPMLLFDLRNYPTGPGASLSVLARFGPIAWLTLAGVSAAVTLLLARSRIAWLSAAVAVLVALPRMGFYNLPILLVGSATPARARPAPGLEGAVSTQTS